jgi:uncharacterized delta-60 repeat protein
MPNTRRQSRRSFTASRAERLENRMLLSGGDLDPTFGTGGVAYPGRFDYATVASATAVAFAPDGKVVVMGVARGAVNAAAVLARFNPDGSPDLTFDGDGKIVFPDILASDQRQSGALAVQADGKVVMAAGELIVRLKIDGSLDETFHFGGRLQIPMFDAGDITEMAIQPDGRIVVGGAREHLKIARIDADGFLDSTFDGGGTTTANLPSNAQFALLTDLAILPNGRIAASLVAHPDDPTRQHGLVARFNAGGGIDSTFDDDGYVDIVVPGSGTPVSQSATYAVRGLPDNRIAVAGTTNGGFFFARFRTDGRTDPTYDADGYVFTPNASPDPNVSLFSVAFRQMEYAPDGKVVAAGPAPEWLSPGTSIVARRFNEDGALDPSFGTGGEVRTPVGTEPRATELAIAANGGVAVSVSGTTNGPKQFAAVRYAPTGQPEPAATNGVMSATFVIPGAEPSLSAVAETAGGKLIAAGTLANGLSRNPVLVRFNSDGSLDTSFGNGGWTVVSVPGFPLVTIAEALVLPDGRIVVGGTALISPSPERQFLVGRFTAAGVPDPTFSGDGFMTTRIEGGAAAFVNDIAVDTAGRIVAAGSYRPEGGTQSQFAAARYNPDGSPDNSFSGDGVVFTNVGTGPDSAESVAILSDGGVLLGGVAFDMVGGNHPAWAFVKYRPDGTLDPTFGNQPGDPGLTIIAPAELGGMGTDVVAREGGGFYAAGTASFLRNNNEVADIAVGAFTANGTPDGSFGGGDGFALAGFSDGRSSSEAFGARLARQPDGKLVAAGTTGTSSTATDFGVARFTAAGVLDTAFSQDGRTITDLSPQDLAADMALQSDGRIVVIGGTNPPARAVLLRYQGDAFTGLADVYVRGSAWAGDFKTYMEAQGLGDDVYGYRVANGTGNDSILPWVNVDEIVLRYGAPPTGGGIPSPGTVSLDGVRSDYTVASVTSLDPQTYVLRLDRPLGRLPAGGENGDRVRMSVGGAGAGGGPAAFTLNVLQGDVNRSGTVVATDFSEVTSRFFRTTAQPGPAGPTQYTIFHDVDGSGAILANDFSLVKARFFDTLPPAEAAAATLASAPRRATQILS